jgi:hypothetical protein
VMTGVMKTVSLRMGRVLRAGEIVVGSWVVTRSRYCGGSKGWGGRSRLAFGSRVRWELVLRFDVRGKFVGDLEGGFGIAFGDVRWLSGLVWI